MRCRLVGLLCGDPVLVVCVVLFLVVRMLVLVAVRVQRIGRCLLARYDCLPTLLFVDQLCVAHSYF